MIQFDDKDDRETILKSGPTFIHGKFFTIQAWSVEAEMQREKVERIPIWVKLFNLPRELWLSSGIGYASSFIGTPHGMDAITAKGTRLDFAHVCIYINAGKELNKKIPVFVGRETFFTAEYPWLPKSCTTCRVFGHDRANCPILKDPVYTVEVPSATISAPETRQSPILPLFFNKYNCSDTSTIHVHACLISIAKHGLKTITIPFFLLAKCFFLFTIYTYLLHHV